MTKAVWAGLIGILALTGAARADDYPSHPITIIVPFAAGGPSDAMARVLAERMRTTLGQPLVIENVTGAGGSIGVGRAVHSPADGYTISFGHLGTHDLVSVGRGPAAVREAAARVLVGACGGLHHAVERQALDHHDLTHDVLLRAP